MQATITFTNVSVVEMHKLAVAFREVFFCEEDATTHECAGQCEAQAEPEVVAVDPYEVLMDALTDPRYQYRSVKSLAEKAGVPFNAVENILIENGVKYECKQRRSDAATLIGLVAQVESPAPAATNVISKFDKLLDALNHPTYVWRTVEALVEKTGYADRDAILTALDENEVEFETADRNSDGKPIIALASRI